MTEELIEVPIPSTPAVEGSKLDTLEAPKYTQAELDRKVQEGVATNAKKLQDKLEVEKAKAERELLAKQGQYEELTKKLSGEVEALRRENDAKELKAQVRAALDAAGLSSYAPIFDNDTNTMEGCQAIIDKLGIMTEKAVETGVAGKLKTPAPLVSPGTPKPLNLDAQIAEATAKQDWPLVTRLNNQKMTEMYGDKH